MEGDHDLFSNARIIDLRDSTVIDLNVENKVSIGLTVDDQVLSSTSTDANTQAVISLCHVERRTDGHWLIPDPYLPCLLNDEDVTEPTLLSQGSTVKCGDRFLRYTYFQTKKRRMLPRTPGTPFLASPALRTNLSTPVSTGPPPPKPKRSWVYTGSTETINLVGSEENPDECDEEVDTGVLEISQPEFGCSFTSVDEELLNHVQSPIEIANMAASYVCRQVMMYTDTVLSSGQLDHLFKALQCAASYAEKVISTFISEYTEVQRTEEGNFSSGSTHSLLPTEARPIHGPVIHLLIELLKLSLDPEEHVELWMQLLCTFSHFTQNLSDLLQHQGAPVVMGVMAAFGRSVDIQQYACSILSQLALHQPSVGEKGPVRESAVELTVRAMKLHPADTRILRPACRTLANITTTYSSLTEQILSPEMEMQWETFDASDLVENWMNLLNCIQRESLATVLDVMEANPHDLGVQTEGRRILFFFFDPDLEIENLSEGDLLQSAKHSFIESIDLDRTESGRSLESSLTTVSSWHDESISSVWSETEAEISGNREGKTQTKSCTPERTQPDLISEVGSSSSPPPDLVSSQDLCKSAPTVENSNTDKAERNSGDGKSKKKKRTTHKDIKSKVKAMVNKGKLKINDSIAKRKRKSLTNEGIQGTFKKNLVNDQESVDLSDLKRNLTALLTNEANGSHDNNEGFSRVDIGGETDDVKDKGKFKPSVKQATEPKTNSGISGQLFPSTEKPEIRVTASDDIDENEDLHQLQRRFSTRKRWSTAEKPQIQNLLDLSQDSLSLADSLEGATYMSGYSCSDYEDNNSELDPELIEDIRMNKMKWKKVVGQIKDVDPENQLTLRKHSVEDTTPKRASVNRELSLNPTKHKTLEVEFEPSRKTISPVHKRKEAIDLSLGDTDDESTDLGGPSPDNSKDSDDYLVIASPERRNSGSDLDEKPGEDINLLVTDEAGLFEGNTSEKVEETKTSKSFRLTPLLSKAKSMSPFGRRKSESGTKDGKKTHKKGHKKNLNVVDTNSNFSVENNDTTSLGKQDDDHDVNEGRSDQKGQENKRSKQQKKKSPKGTKTAQRISQDHDSMMQILASRTLILNHVMMTWKMDRPKALGLLQAPLHQILGDANAPPDIVTVLEQQKIDKLLLRDADPALAMNLLQVLCDSPFGQQIALKLAENTSQLLSDRHRPYHVNLAATCLNTMLQGPLAKADAQGNDMTVLKTIHKKTEALLQHKNMDATTFSSLSLLNTFLEERLLCRHKSSTLTIDYV